VTVGYISRIIFVSSIETSRTGFQRGRGSARQNQRALLRHGRRYDYRFVLQSQ
jgi:hypothetical protein